MTQIVVGKPSGGGENTQTHPEVLDPALSRGGWSRANRESAKLRQHWLDIPGSVFWDGEVLNPAGRGQSAGKAPRAGLNTGRSRCVQREEKYISI